MTVSIGLRLAFEPCPRTCSNCDGKHHWYPGEDEGAVCKHCEAVIPWDAVCHRCGDEFIDHWEEGGDLSCASASIDGGECHCPLFVHETGKESIEGR